MSARVARAPGRVNLLGEHTDYNDGFVLPVAIDRFTRVDARRRSDRVMTVTATDLGERDEFTLDAIDRTDTWRDYVRGVVALLRPPHGFDLVIASSLPRGAGLSSSAALEVAVGRAVSDLPAAELALLCQRAENDFVGVQCGIMDQFTVANARAGHALFLDCRNLACRYLPIPSDAAIVVCESRLERRLAASGYNERRAECAQAAAALGLRALRDAAPEQLGSLPSLLHRRVRHVATENARALAGAAALEAGDLAAFGSLMNESHQSARIDFDICPPEVDRLAAHIRAVPGCYGARMTGGGFGGCTVSLVKRDAVTAVRIEAETLGATVLECVAVGAVEVSGDPLEPPNAA